MSHDRPQTELRGHAAKGVVINGAFTVGIYVINLLRGYAVAAFLTASEYGLWGLLFIGLGTLSFLRQLGIGDKYVQQDDEDQEVAYQKAFTLELYTQLAYIAFICAAIPLMALAYDEPKMILPGYVLTLSMFAQPFQSTLWIHYRRMDFFRQRVLQSIDPVLGSAAMIGLAIAGAGAWSFVIGTIVGAWATAIVSVAQSPYRLRIRRDVKAFREYGSFSYPLVVMGLGGVLVAQGTMLVGKWELGLAGAGAITLASSIVIYTERVNEILMRSLYPALCVARDRLDVLHEAFIKSNRLSLMWALPFGIGVVLFAPDLVDRVLGPQWEHATTLIQLFALTACLRHVAGNWGGFYMARGETKPQMIRGLTVTAWFFAVVIPSLLTWGLDGLGWGMVSQSIVGLTVQAYYMRRLFQGFRLLPHFVRSWLPLAPAAALVLLLRVTESGPREPWMIVTEVVVYLGVVAVATIILERPLLREAVAYLRNRQRSGPLLAS